MTSSAASSAVTRGTRPVLADVIPGARVRDALLVVAGAGLTGLAAQVAIHTPLSPVPFTLQTLAALLVGASLGSTRGVLSMLIYLAAGVAGVPWFAAGSHGLGATFGYIVGFVAAAAVVGALARRGSDRRVLTTVLLMAVGSAVIYLIGASWLAVSLNLGPAAAFRLGVLPFLLGDALKAAVAAVVLPGAWKLLSRVR